VEWFLLLSVPWISAVKVVKSLQSKSDIFQPQNGWIPICETGYISSFRWLKIPHSQVVNFKP
jgi:hypothetical protein